MRSSLLTRDRLFNLQLRFVLSRCFSTGEKRGSVWSFGDNSNGALGLPAPSTDAYEPTKVPELPCNIIQVAAGHYHSLAVTAEGEVWAWGRNEEGQLGRCIDSPRNSWSKPERVRGLDGVEIRAVSASGVTSSAIGKDGSLWVWGRSKRGQLGLGRDVIEAKAPSRVKSLIGCDIVKVSLGWGHALAVTREGKLFGWGYSDEGRLGQMASIFHSTPSIYENLAGLSDVERKTPMFELVKELVEERIKREDNMPIIWEPCLVKETSNVTVSDVSCGLDHSLVLCCDGTLLSGGENTYGQLARKTGEPSLLPVADISSFNPVSLASGLGHSLALCHSSTTENNTSYKTVVLSWGWNIGSQLGRSGNNEVPGLVEGLEGEHILSVSAGRVHSIALTGEGKVFIWGSGRNGRLGLGHSIDEAGPVLIESLDGFRVLQAVAGFDHNLLLVAD
ncbi:Ultraviolet-B receptor UVR8 [Carex littledalei]|uniref:Ultraviolet-B receptor UVR8 n=1 Tax=Carex littledalei TaxID=544730 RepID=A0A833V2S2_9POAL|nr:Ultraviolet-B receptor UVR8 [Carex littledalei]